MTGNPKDSKWKNTPWSERHKKRLALTVSPEAREKLERLARKSNRTMSEVVEELILTAK